MALKFPPELLYSDTHEWVQRRKDGNLIIGITDFAQRELGEVVFVDLPSVGDAMDAGESLCTLESVKAVSDVYAPVAGEVLEVNEDLMEEPGKINASAYEDGWLLVLKPSASLNNGEIPGLTSADDYRQQVSE